MNANLNEPMVPEAGAGRTTVPAGTSEKICPVCKTVVPLYRACCSECGHWFRTYFVTAEAPPQAVPRSKAAKVFALCGVSGGVLLALIALLLAGLSVQKPNRQAPLDRWAATLYQSPAPKPNAQGT